MKFGEHLIANKNKEWEDQYLAYDKLDVMISDLEQKHVGGSLVIISELNLSSSVILSWGSRTLGKGRHYRFPDLPMLRACPWTTPSVRSSSSYSSSKKCERSKSLLTNRSISQ